MAERDINGFEFDWFAVDSEGNIGHFSTAGFGPTPHTVEIESHDSAYEFFCGLEELGDYELLTRRGGSNNDWIHTAKCGVFSYDWKHGEGPYLMIARPKVPIKLSALPTWVQTVCQQVCLNTLSFPEHLSIRVEDYFERK